MFRPAVMTSLMWLCVLVTAPKPVSAQGSCGHYNFCFEQQSHSVWPQTENGGADNPHAFCLYCYGPPESCHSFCDITDEEERAALDLAVGAASRGDLTALLRVAPKTRGRVVLDGSITAVTVLTCSRRGVLATVALKLQDFLVHWAELGVLGIPTAFRSGFGESATAREFVAMGSD
jgi:hypothetical protein